MHSVNKPSSGLLKSLRTSLHDSQAGGLLLLESGGLGLSSQPSAASTNFVSKNLGPCEIGPVRLNMFVHFQKELLPAIRLEGPKGGRVEVSRSDTMAL